MGLISQVLCISVISSLLVTWVASEDSSLDKNMELIEKAAAKLDASRFKGDPTVTQVIDRLNSKTYYKLGNDVAFERDTVDSGRAVVVLKPGEDHVQPKKKKRIFVVFKKMPHVDKAYWVTFAYLRTFIGKDDPAERLEIDGESLRIEWDTWQHRGNLHNAARAFGWTTCAESIFVACKAEGNSSRNSVSMDYEDEVKSVAGIQLDDLSAPKQDVSSEVKEPQWGLNSAAESTIAQSEFVASLTGKAGYEVAKNDGSGTISGSDGEEEFDFLADLDDSPAEARMVGSSAETISNGASNGLALSLTGADFFSQVGWKTQDILKTKLHKQIQALESEPFIGYGTCPYTKQTVNDLDDLNTTTDATKFYLTTLRNQCSQRHELQILNLFAKGILTLNKDNTLSVPSANPLLSSSKLTKRETEDLSKAYETSMFSQAYAAELRHPSKASVDPEGRDISRCIFTLIRMALHTLKQSKDSIPAHYILVTRNLVQTLKSTNTKSLQDYEKIKSCADCPQHEKDVAVSDIYNLQAIQQFIIHALATIVNTDQCPFDAYEKYFKDHKASIAGKTKRYL